MISKTYYKYIHILTISLSRAHDNTNTSHLVNINIPEVSLINVVSSLNNTILFDGSSVTEAGKTFMFNKSDKSVWINYSSIVGSRTEPSRHVSIEISEGKVPDGLVLSVKVSEDKGLGGGKMGKSINKKQALTNNPTMVINEIESSYTGVGANKGHNVEYILELKDEKDSYANLDFDQTIALNIIYTLSDN